MLFNLSYNNLWSTCKCVVVILCFSILLQQKLVREEEQIDKNIKFYSNEIPSEPDGQQSLQ